MDFAAAYDALNPDDHDHRFYAALAAEVRATSVLDLGCGTGTLTRLLAAPGRTAVGIDPDPAMLAVARSHPSPVSWRLGFSDQARTAEADFAVLSGHAAQVFLTDDAWATALADLHRALRPGGTLTFESRDPAARAWESWTRDLTTGEVSSTPDTLAFRDEHALTASVTAAGFTVTHRFGDWDRSPTGPELILVARRLTLPRA